jgi:hypothetical protein
MKQRIAVRKSVVLQALQFFPAHRLLDLARDVPLPTQSTNGAIFCQRIAIAGIGRLPFSRNGGSPGRVILPGAFAAAAGIMRALAWVSNGDRCKFPSLREHPAGRQNAQGTDWQFDTGISGKESGRVCCLLRHLRKSRFSRLR